MVRHKGKSGRRKRNVNDFGLGNVEGAAVFMSERGQVAAILTMRRHRDGYSFESVEVANGAIHTRQIRDYRAFMREVRRLKDVYAKHLVRDPNSLIVAPLDER